ncbi:MAG: DUF2027 domain-containing protein [Duncaniella sp.]|nr:DUF2027 domain-containing protein [Duncaniella sp.]
MMAKIGDRVRFLNSIGGGVITRIEGNIAYVDDDGFETPTLLRECVVVAPAEDTRRKVADSEESLRAAVEAPKTAASAGVRQPETKETVEETPEGEKLNVVLAFEPTDIKRLNTTTFDTYLVNDSNYYLYFTYLSRADEADGWTTRYAGVVEPGIQVLLEEITAASLPAMDRIAVQLLAFKNGKEFKLKNPVLVELPLDTTKFLKLHCFRESVYFDKDVIAIAIVPNARPRSRTLIDSGRIEEGIRQKKAVDRPVRKPVKKQRKPGTVIEVDLHINELIDSTAGLSPADMLNLQVDEFRRVMDENLKHHGQKIVFIHGKGEGVLRSALMKELNHRYKGHDVQDASFREYGFGATQVTIR